MRSVDFQSMDNSFLIVRFVSGIWFNFSILSSFIFYSISNFRAKYSYITIWGISIFTSSSWNELWLIWNWNPKFMSQLLYFIVFILIWELENQMKSSQSSFDDPGTLSDPNVPNRGILFSVKKEFKTSRRNVIYYFVEHVQS